MSGTRLSFVTLNIPDNRVLQNGLINGNLHYINLSRYTNYVYCIVRTCVGQIMIGIDFFFIFPHSNLIKSTSSTYYVVFINVYL